MHEDAAHVLQPELLEHGARHEARRKRAPKDLPNLPVHAAHAQLVGRQLFEPQRRGGATRRVVLQMHPRFLRRQPERQARGRPQQHGRGLVEPQPHSHCRALGADHTDGDVRVRQDVGPSQRVLRRRAHHCGADSRRGARARLVLAAEAHHEEVRLV